MIQVTRPKVQFEEAMLDNNSTYFDTTIAAGTFSGILPPPDTSFAVIGPYSNPSLPGAPDVSILVHYCASGSLISAQVYDMLGNPIGWPSTFTSDGQTWDRIPVTAPPVSGTYYIVVTCAGNSKTLGYTVY
ncbi:MAG: hypothetical protein Q8922_10170 [Bacteroidota bacterium]|nr:hypothetical protein [Bacteroidota bacterium]MDP4233938.1 hypothetical protein [Bacteroidota bacterium]MDP4242811.1 hypothetical protein [Bacteroidota bacterium]MDP4288289.1 hypothetical protein [Bacteroidota bacterium]